MKIHNTGATFLEKQASEDENGFVGNEGIRDVWATKKASTDFSIQTMPLFTIDDKGREKNIGTDGIFVFMRGEAKMLGLAGKRNNIQSHDNFVYRLASSIKQPVSGMLLSSDGRTLAVQYDMPMLNYANENIRQVLVVAHDIMRGSQVLLSNLPLFCTNQIPLLKGNKKGNGFGNMDYITLDMVTDAVSNMLLHGKEKVVAAFELIRSVELNSDQIETIVRNVYTPMRKPNIEINDVNEKTGEIVATEKWKNWHKSQSEFRAKKDKVFEIMANRTGTHVTQARQGSNGYALLQAVAEYESHHDSKKATFSAWFNGKKSDTVSKTFSEIAFIGTRNNVIPTKK
jgi:hypothetical protein